jgi:PST family polysaccharide transporter
MLVTLPYPGFEFDRGLWTELIAFGAPLSIASALAFLMLNVDYVVVGNRLGSEDLGVYFLAFGLASFPVLVISTTIRRVAMPAFARLAADRDRLVASILSSLQLLLAVTLPGCAILAFLAVPIVDVVYGSKWAAAAAPLAPLAGLAAIRIVTELLYDLHVAMAWTGRVMWIQLVWVAALVPALVAGAARDGIRGVAIGQVVVGALIGLPLFLLALRRVGIGAPAVARVAWPAVAASVLVGLIVLVLDRVIPSQLLLLIIALPACVLAAALVQRRYVWPLLATFTRRAAVEG